MGFIESRNLDRARLLAARSHCRRAGVEPESIDVVLASTSDRSRQHEFRSPRLQRAPERRTMSIDVAEPHPEVMQAT